MKAGLLRAGAAILFLALAATAGHAQSAFSSGYDAYRDGDFETARSLWQPLADAGDARAQFNLGVLYAEGRGVERDMRLALAWWQKSAKQGHVRAAHNMGLALIAGEPRGEAETLEPDFKGAAHWLRIGAEAGYANSLYTLGRLYLEGLGVERDTERAAQLVRDAAERGFTRAQFLLGKLYETGDGVDTDPESAIYWYREAASHGSAQAQTRMAESFALGQLVERNDVEALKWALMADAQGSAHAHQQVIALETRMTPEQVAEAKVRVQTEAIRAEPVSLRR
ncbi:MAG: sel1 repeat family protein [Alphaproteobacteria bacterium]|nr:sel1 repeat family protein [Alphaproteobacteria bacterium]